MTDIEVLQSHLAFWELAGYVATAIVLIGVIGESIFEFLPWIISPQLKPRIGRASALILIVGLASELLTQVKVSTISNQIIAILYDDAAKANRDLAKLKAPRYLNEEQLQSLNKDMEAFPNQHVSVGAIPYTFESASLADQIIRTLKTAKVNAEFNQGAAETQIGATRGVLIKYITGNTKGEKLARILAKLLNDADIKAVSAGGLMDGLPLAGNKEDKFNEWVVIAIGDKI